jgi:hypothetical protein
MKSRVLKAAGATLLQVLALKMVLPPRLCAKKKNRERVKVVVEGIGCKIKLRMRNTVARKGSSTYL